MIDIQDFLKYVSLGELEINPGESKAAYSVTQAVLEGNRYSREIWVCDLLTGSNTKVLSDGQCAANFYWADDNHLFYTTRSENVVSCCLMNISDGSVQTIAQLPGEAKGVWQTGENTFCYTAPRMLLKNDYPEELKFLADHDAGFETIDEIPLWDNGRAFTSGKRTAMVRLTLGSEPVQLTKPETTVDTVRLVGSDLLYTARTYRGSNTEPGIYKLSPEQAPVCLVAEGTFRVYDFGTDASGKLFFIAQDKNIHTMTDDPGFYTVENGSVVKLPISDRSASDSVSFDVQYSGCQSFAVQDGKIYYPCTKEWSSFVESVTLDGTETAVLTPEGGSVSGFALLKDGRIVFIGVRGTELQEMYLWDGSLKKLTNHNDSRLDQTQVIQPDHFTFQQFGFNVNYTVLRPANFDPEKKYPAILYIHGGAKVLYTTVFFHEMQYLANCGYFVIYGNPHGSDGQGSEFANLLGHYGEKDFADLMKAMDTALELYPNIDPERLGVCGGSYGGIMTNWCVTHTDRFKCGCAQRSICSMVSTFGTADNGFGFVREQMDGDLWNGFDKLWRQSPLKYANNCHTPLLLIHSDEDHRCDYTEAVQMFTALKYLGVESKVILIRGENHNLSRSGRPVQRIKRMYEIRKWLDEHLMPVQEA